MSYNGSGTFNINSTGQPVVAGTVITASAFNALTTDLATGLTTAITKDGQTTTTARITFAQGITSSLVTDSSSVSTGSIITAGGAGIAKNLYVGVNANVAGTLGVTGVATFSAAPIYSSLTASSAVATDASKGLVSVTNTGTGNNVLATSPTITTPTISSLSSAAATALTLQSAGTTAVTVDTSQRVGIGGTPVKTLSILPTSIRRMDFFVRDPGVDDSLVIRSQHATNNNIRDMILEGSIVKVFTGADSGGSGTESLRIDSSGNLLIGTTTNLGKVSVQGTITAKASADESILSISHNGSEAVISASYGSTGSYDPMVFKTSDTERMRIDTSGNILVNRTTVLLDGQYCSDYNGNTRRGIVLNNSTGTNNANLVTFASSGSALASISQSFSTIVYGTTSDYRLKEDVIPMTGALAKVNLLKPCTYTWKEGSRAGQGFIAHEIQEVIPECVVGEKDAVDKDGNPQYQNIDTSFLVATLTAAIQELKAINDSLTARIVALESK